MKSIREVKGITLVALIVTIVILLILVGVTIAQLTGKGIFDKSREAAYESKKQEAIESMNFKITECEMASYIKKQDMPTLQELADFLCENEDGTIEYVNAESKKISSLPKINVVDTIFVKLAAYTYEFEINNDLQLEAIDGVKIAKENVDDNNDGGSTSSGAFIFNVEGTIQNTMPQKDDGYICLQAVCTQNSNVTFDNDTWSLTWNNITTSNTVCTLYFYKKNDWKTLLKFIDVNPDEYSNFVDALYNNQEVISKILNDERASKYLYLSPDLINNTIESICSNADMFVNVIENENHFLKLLSFSTFRQSMYNNYQITQSLLQNSTNALATIAKCDAYTVTSFSNYTRANDYNTLPNTIYNGKAFLLKTTIDKATNGAFSIGTFLDGTATYSPNINRGNSNALAGEVYTFNKFMNQIKGSKYQTNGTQKISYYYLKIDD